jgi:thymidylate synthase (FAD)
MSQVELVGITKPSAITGCSTSNELVAWAARVSNPSNQNNTTTAPKLVQYLVKNQHWSPMEIVHVAMRITTTRDIARQILRHRSFSFQEFSQRYADPTKDMGFVTRDARLQDAKNRQNSVELTPDENRLAEEWSIVQKQAINAAEFAYRWAIGRGIAKEQARVVLPEGNTESTMIMAGTLRSWVHYVELRTECGTQKEHRIVASQCKTIIAQHFPDVAAALNWTSDNSIS